MALNLNPRVQEKGFGFLHVLASSEDKFFNFMLHFLVTKLTPWIKLTKTEIKDFN